VHSVSEEQFNLLSCFRLQHIASPSERAGERGRNGLPIVDASLAKSSGDGGDSSMQGHGQGRERGGGRRGGLSEMIERERE
jgi:hypothetical protein